MDDGQMQGDRAVATVDGLEFLRVIAAFDVGFIVPSITVDGRFRELDDFSRIDGQVQRNGTIGAVDVEEMLRVITRNGVGFIIPSI